MSTLDGKHAGRGVSHPYAKGGTGRRREGRVHVHQVIPAVSGTRIMVRVDRPDGSSGWTTEPIFMFALVEDYGDDGELDGERYVVPMRQRGMGCFTPTGFDVDVGDVLAPGEQIPVWK